MCVCVFVCECVDVCVEARGYNSEASDCERESGCAGVCRYTCVCVCGCGCV